MKPGVLAECLMAWSGAEGTEAHAGALVIAECIVRLIAANTKR